MEREERHQEPQHRLYEPLPGAAHGLAVRTRFYPPFLFYLPAPRTKWHPPHTGTSNARHVSKYCTACATACTEAPPSSSMRSQRPRHYVSPTPRTLHGSLGHPSRSSTSTTGGISTTPIRPSL